MIEIIGAHGTITNIESFIKQLLSFSEKENLVIQAFDATGIYGKDHLISATTHAKRAFKQGTNATNTLALEILLYAAGERQIQKAIKKIGVQKGKQKIIFLLTDTTNHRKTKDINKKVLSKLIQIFHLTIDETVLTSDKKTLKRFGISDKELSTVPESEYGQIILEKVALVDVIK
jgi:KEOPS complex subunit Cgi121